MSEFAILFVNAVSCCFYCTAVSERHVMSCSKAFVVTSYMKWLVGSGLWRSDVRRAGGSFCVSGDRSQHLVTLAEYRHNYICTAVCIELETQRQLYGNRT